MRHTLIDCRRLVVERDVRILDGIDWCVARGERWVILGPNGSGKTSLLQTLTGFVPPTSGQVRVLGRLYGRSDWRALRRKIGLVSSGLAEKVAPDDTAVETVVGGRDATLGVWAPTRPALRKEARRILEAIGCAGIAERRWSCLSAGERQRLLIGRALMARHRLLFLDEPCAGLDPVAREHFLGFLARLVRATDGPGIILVTHHVEEIVPGVDSALVLSGGRVIAAGPIRDTLTRTTLSRAFGAPVSVSVRHGRYRLRVEDGGMIV